jgi:hypothetical protein
MVADFVAAARSEHVDKAIHCLLRDHKIRRRDVEVVGVKGVRYTRRSFSLGAPETEEELRHAKHSTEFLTEDAAREKTRRLVRIAAQQAQARNARGMPLDTMMALIQATAGKRNEHHDEATAE